VPWCDTCDRIVGDDELVDGACPTCATELTEPVRQPVSLRFKFLVAATVVYLGWRTFQGVQWLTHHA
jgi:uncharacterized paraquat-inducible protein A